MIKKFKLFEGFMKKSSSSYSYNGKIPQLTEDELNQLKQIMGDKDRILEEYDLIVKLRKPNLPFIDFYRKDSPYMPRGVYDVHKKLFTIFYRGDTLLDEYIYIDSNTFYDELDNVDFLMMSE